MIKLDFDRDAMEQKCPNNLPKFFQIIDRKQSTEFRRIFTVASDGLLGPVNVKACPAGARNRRNATLKIQRNQLLRFVLISLVF